MVSIAIRLEALARRLPCPDSEHTRPIEPIEVHAGELIPPATPRPSRCPMCRRALSPITRIVVAYPAEVAPP